MHTQQLSCHEMHGTVVSVVLLDTQKVNVNGQCGSTFIIHDNADNIQYQEIAVVVALCYFILTMYFINF